MEKKNGLLAVVLALSLIAAVLAALSGQQQTQPEASEPQQGRVILISELCTKNETVIADNDGKYPDYIELYNAGDRTDLTGCYLTDGKNKSPVFDGPVLESGESWLVFLGESYTGFGLKASGGDCIQLVDPQGNILAQTNTTAMQEDQVMVYSAGSYVVSDTPSPGFSNGAEGIRAYREGTRLDSPAVTISEVLTQNVSSLPDEHGRYVDVIELHNTTEEAICLNGWYLSDGSGRFTYRIPDITLEADGYLPIYCDGEHFIGQNGQLHVNFGLSHGETVYLTDRQGGYTCLAVEYPGEDISLALTQAGYAASPVSLGYANTEDGAQAFRESRMNTEGALIISEVLLSSAGVPYEGLFQDVVEITNRSEEAVSTSGWYLSDGGDPYTCPLPEETLQPGQTLVMVCSPQSTGFGIAREETLYLTGPDYRHLPPVSCSLGEQGQSLSLCDYEAGSYGFRAPSLGYGNTAQNEAAYRAAQLPEGLRISEVISANDSYLKGYYAKTCDWLELYNGSGETVELSEYCISNSAGNLSKFTLPEKTLAPGEYCVIFLATDSKNLLKGYPVIGFTLSSQGENIYLSKNGEVVDYVMIPALDRDVSYGRPAGSAMFDTLSSVTPEKPNAEAARIAAAPVAVTAQGSYDGVEYLDVVLEGEGDIYYTTDCTSPNRYDKRYTGPILITETTVIRAYCCVEGKKASPVVDLTYLINEADTLEAVCIVTEPKNLFSQETGIYAMGPNASETFPYYNANFWMDWEREATVSFFETDGSTGFCEPCGIKIFGNASRGYDKKSLSVFFRDTYGAGTLEYPLFGDAGLDSYEAFVLRAGGQDTFTARMRDELITSLVADYTQVAVQKYRPVVVYLNGTYYGVYYIREKINEHYVSGNYCVDARDVTLCEWNGYGSTEYRALFEYVSSHSLANQQNYDYVCSQIDIDEYIDYMVAQIWMGNKDNSNIKFFKTTQGKWTWILYDTDQGFKDVYYDAVADHLNPAGTGAEEFLSTELINSLLANADFRAAFLSRLAWQIQTVWTQENVTARVDELQTAIEADMVKDCRRWGEDYDQWLQFVQSLRNFPVRRTQNVIEDVQAYFHLTKDQMREYGFAV